MIDKIKAYGALIVAGVVAVLLFIIKLKSNKIDDLEAAPKAKEHDDAIKQKEASLEEAKTAQKTAKQRLEEWQANYDKKYPSDKSGV